MVYKWVSTLVNNCPFSPVHNHSNYTFDLIKVNKCNRPKILIILNTTHNLIQYFDFLDSHIDKWFSFDFIIRGLGKVNDEKPKYLAIEIMQLKLGLMSVMMSIFVHKKLILKYKWVYVQCQLNNQGSLTWTNDMSQLSDWSGISSWPCIVSPPSNWHACLYWMNRVVFGMSWQIILIGFLKQVASIVVSSFHKGYVIGLAGHTGGVRTNNGSGAGENKFAGWLTFKGLT